MPGWRVGFVVGNKRMVGDLSRINSYLDYGMFQAIQIAATVALNGPYRVVEEAVEVYWKRRDCLGVGFGERGDGFVRFALVENDPRIRQAIRGAKAVLQAPVKVRAR